MSLADQIAAEAPALRRYALKLTRDADRADDLVQDTMVRALTKQHLYWPGSNLRAWLMTLAHNLWVTGAERRRLEAAILAAMSAGTELCGLSDTAEMRLTLRDLQSALAALPVEQRRAVVLIGLHGFSQRQASAGEGMPIGTISSRMNRARRTLRRLMAA